MSKEVATELPLASSYCDQSNPFMAQYLLTSQGFDFPDLNNANACQLCIGNGTTITINAAAASTIKWWGNEADNCLFLAAQNLTSGVGVDVNIELANFDEFAKNNNLPQFDFVTINGVWSWISEKERRDILNFLSKHVKAGGVCQVSYLAAPGNTNMGPIVEVLHRFMADNLPGNMPADEKIVKAAELAVEIGKANPVVLIRVPKLLPDLAAAAAGKDDGEFAKNFLSKHWRCFHLREMAAMFDSIDFGFLSSNLPKDQLVYTQLTDEEAEYIEQYRGTTLYETCRDFLLNREYRSDLFCNGVRQLTASQYVQKYNSLTLMLTADLTDFDYKIKCPGGDKDLDRGLYEPLLVAFNDYIPHAIGEVRTALKQFNAEIADSDIDMAINTLVSLGMLVPCADPSNITEKLVEQCNIVNAAVLSDAGMNIRTLASPVLGFGYSLTDIEYRMLQLVTQNDDMQPLSIIEKLLESVIVGDLKLKDVDTTSEDELIEFLKKTVTKFTTFTMPLLYKLGII